MKKIHLISIVLAAASLHTLPACAQSAGEFMNNPAFLGPLPQQCVSTFEMQQCAARDLRVADVEMSNLYGDLRAKLKPSGQRALLAEQRIWLKSRDHDCLAKGSDGGSMASLAVARCWVAVTNARTASLKKKLVSSAKQTPVLPASAFLGRWRGGEGTVMKITRSGSGFAIENQWGLDANMHGVFSGTITADGLRFKRNGVIELARPSTGDAVNRSALAGKKDCLIVSRDEGYCRY